MQKFKIRFVPVRGKALTRIVRAVDEMQALQKASKKIPRSKLPISHLSFVTSRGVLE